MVLYTPDYQAEAESDITVILRTSLDMYVFRLISSLLKLFSSLNPIRCLFRIGS